jgi:AraC-like DNA-binding protein
MTRYTYMRRKLSDQDVQCLHRLRNSGWQIIDLANEFGVSNRTVKYILSGREYKHVHPPPGAEGSPKYQWSDEAYDKKLAENRERARKRRKKLKEQLPSE